MKAKVYLFFFFFVALAITPFVASAANNAQPTYMDEHPTQRLAFVVGNSNYAHQQRVPSSNVDATKFAEALRHLGFTVTEIHDVKKTADFWTINFMPFLSQIKENDFVVFYFSGHGLTYGGENFVAMVDLPETIPEAQILDDLIPLTSLRELIMSRKPGLSLFLLDACRSISGGIQKSTDAPVEAIEKGLAQMKASVENVALGFSSDFGHISKGRDAPGQMSYYTDALLAHLADEGKEFSYVKRQTRLKVIADTSGEQVPWFSDSVSSEIYLKPSNQILAEEKTAWSARLATNDYEQIWDYTQEYPVSRYVAAAKRWLELNKATPPSTTKIAPRSLDDAFSIDEPNKRISVPRVDGPFGFKTVASYSDNSNESFEPINKNIGMILAQSNDLVVTRPMSARLFPDENSEAIQTIKAGSTVQIEEVTRDGNGYSWLKVANDGSPVFLPANRALVGSAEIGYSLQEIEVGPAQGLQSLVDEQPIRSAVASLVARGHAISRVSVATTASLDPRLQLKIKGRVAHTFYVLEQLGIPQGNISSTFNASDENLSNGGKSPAPSNGRVRIRFFGH